MPPLKQDTLYLSYFRGVTGAVTAMVDILYNDNIGNDEIVKQLKLKYGRFYNAHTDIFLSKADRDYVERLRNEQPEEF